MKLAMAQEEVSLLEAFLEPAQTYVEYGSGGSTVLAANFCAQVTTVDTSRDWLDKVKAAVGEGDAQINLQFADLGPTREWGFPNIENPQKFESYSCANDKFVPDADFILIDGRFRVACFARVCELGFRGPIAVHDYTPRPWYFAIEAIARPIARARSLQVFVPTTNADAARDLWSRYKHDPR